MKITKWQSNILVLLIVIIIVCYYSLQGKKNKEIIRANTEFINGKIIECNVDHEGWVHIKYIFSYNDSVFKSDESISIDMWKRNSFLNKTFPVIFSKKKPEINEMLILPKDFEEYNLQYPDSLKWVKELIDKN